MSFPHAASGNPAWAASAGSPIKSLGDDKLSQYYAAFNNL